MYSLFAVYHYLHVANLIGPTTVVWLVLSSKLMSFVYIDLHRFVLIDLQWVFHKLYLKKLIENVSIGCWLSECSTRISTMSLHSMTSYSLKSVCNNT